MSNSLLNRCWKQMIKDFIVTLGSLMLCKLLNTLQTSIQWRTGIIRRVCSSNTCDYNSKLLHLDEFMRAFIFIIPL